MRQLTRRVGRVLGLLVLVASLSGCGRKGQAAAGSEPETFQVSRRPITELSREDGRLQACRIYSFFPEVGDAKLRALYVAEGDSVNEGDKLFAFDTTSMREQIDILRSRTNAIARKIEQAHVDAEMRRMAAETELTEATRALEIQEQLLPEGLSSAAEVEASRKKQRSAELSLHAEGAERDAKREPRESPEVAELEVERMESARDLRLLEERMEQCIGKAPFAGRVIRINDAVKEYGADTKSLNMPFTPGRGPLVIIADTREMRIVGRFFERDIVGIKTGQKALVTAEHVPGRTFAGRIVSVGEIGYAHGQTSTIAVEALVDNADGLLKSGLTAEISVVVDEKADALAIPSKFLRRESGGYYVWRINGSRKEKVAVTTGVSDEEYAEIVSGLKENDTVVME
jgi:multidrug efflux pump subunit AcrA (membrane-fusion protein)